MESTEKKISKNGIISIIILLLVISVVVIGMIFFRKAEKQKKIDALLLEIDTNYQRLDLEAVEKCVVELDGLGYNVSTTKEILEYDKSVKDDVVGFYEEIEEVDKQLKAYSVSSLNSLTRDLNSMLNIFSDLPENENSELGKYISSVKNNTMYKTLKSQLNSDVGAVDFDYGLVKDGYIMVFETYTNEILKIEFPYDYKISQSE